MAQLKRAKQTLKKAFIKYAENFIKEVEHLSLYDKLRHIERSIFTYEKTITNS